VYGEAYGEYGRGVCGMATAVSGRNYGVYGQSASPSGYGVYGSSVAESGGGSGVYGVTSSPSGIGVAGFAAKTFGTGYGVYGYGNSPDGYDFYAAGPGTNYGSSSSIRWKHNLEPIPEPLDMLGQLRGVYFDWDAEHGGHHDVGMVAEEVGLVLPEIVNYEENGIDASGMDYSKLTPLLVEAVNALRAEKDAEIALRDRRIASLEQTNAQLEDRLARLEALVNELASRQEIER
jgi:hypothetical protein